MSREAAAAYIGVSATKFDELVSLGTMPGPKHIGTRRVWDVRSLDVAFDNLPDAESAANDWDELLSGDLDRR